MINLPFLLSSLTCAYSETKVNVPIVRSWNLFKSFIDKLRYIYHKDILVSYLSTSYTIFIDSSTSYVHIR